MFLIMRFLGSVILFLFFTFSVHAKVKIITIGDSTMAEYDPYRKGGLGANIIYVRLVGCRYGN